ncbi:hypothetical protein BUALT_Bualt08G0119000 [Buddleja alternifolia]|uniref:Filament-like plant protein n=1 Tax=Buddleja alternifolia TaxID=168488 RepID=A0AAV6XDR7_9LAMI|nr:hypothetical protein BUALT_Bualt08G0119000 [Buddleja alternifolia]
MDKKKWLWKRKSSERSPGESESSGSFSSHSERYSDEQDALRESQNDSTQSPEVTSKTSTPDNEVKESVKNLTEKLSAALVNVSAKEELVKQHAKVAEEAVAGWEKAENEAATIKQQLEAAVQQNLNLEVRVSHLDGALKECVRQLRQARDEQEKRISNALMEKNSGWELKKADLEKQILELQTKSEASTAENPNTLLILEQLEKENTTLKQELVLRCKELEVMTVERDLSTQAAESASKLQLESIKKVTKLEAECRRLQSMAKKSSPVNNSKSVHGSNFYAESLTDSHSDSHSDSWASALITELDQFKIEKRALPKSLAEIDMMDDFLEMERLAALSETKTNTALTGSGECFTDNPLRAELDSMIQKVSELEKKLEKIEAEKLEIENALDESESSLKAAQSKIFEGENKLEELQKELKAANEAKELLEFQLVSMEVETRTMSANVDSLKGEIQKERTLSAELTVKCREMENELRTVHETELQQNINSNSELKLKQEDLAVAADKLAECQKTIASLGRQLSSLATLEDFLIDTSNIPGFSRGPLVSGSNEKRNLDTPRISIENGGHLENGNSEESPPLSTSSANHTTTTKSRNGFGKFFSRSKSVIELDNRQD